MILLPPSEAKRPGGRGRSLQRAEAAEAPGPLAAARLQVRQALGRLTGDPSAAERLLLPASVAVEALANNARVEVAGTTPAVRRYAGVVYDGLAWDDLSPAAKSAANRQLLIFSGLFGVLRGSEPVPAYRVPAKAVLPGVGVVGTFWRRELIDLLPELLGRGPIIDLRSTDYASMWQPRTGSDEADRHVQVRVLSSRPDGSLGVISYNSKLAKGKLAAALLEAHPGRRTEPADPTGAIADAWQQVGGKDLVTRPVKVGLALDLIA